MNLWHCGSRLGPYFCQPVIAGLGDEDKPFICTMDSIGANAPLLQLSATTSVYDGESNCPEHEKQEQVADGRVDDLLPNVERPQLVRQGQVQEAVDELHNPEGCQNGASCLDCQAEEGQKLSNVSHNFDGDDINEQNYRTEPCLTSGNGHLIVDSRESELPNNIWEGESYHIFESLRG
ncbi:hypothetical protein GBA52_029156 [Prunus armeniaca]|nr:hypothetical protein GBA52_029156 [Prunus armeniaca]